MHFFNIYDKINYKEVKAITVKMKEDENMGIYYDGTKLLSMSDIDGNKPEIYMCTSNRSAGKTTYFSRLCVNRFRDKNEKFILIYRFSYELNNIADKFFKEIQELFFPNFTMKSESRSKGIYHDLYLVKKGDEENKSLWMHCGYAIALNYADQIKRLSHLFSDAVRMFFDEFQSETNHYCNNEVMKFISIHISIARGGGKQSKYLPVYMTSNSVTLLNPYYTELGIAPRLQKNTRFLKGVGFVLEQGYVEAASKAQEESAFNRAFSKSQYVQYAAQNIYLNDNESFVEKMTGSSTYVCTLRYKNSEFALRIFPNKGIVYCDDRADTTFKTKLAITTDDHTVNYVLLNSEKTFFATMRYYFDKGCFRFKNLRCKECIMTALSY